MGSFLLEILLANASRKGTGLLIGQELLWQEQRINIYEIFFSSDFLC